MKLISNNKKAFHNYTVLDTLEVGVVLTGDEVKSIRAGKISIDESFALVKNNELVLLNCYIAPYSHAYSKDDVSRRTRVLLAQKRQIVKLVGEVSKKGVALIPLKVYINEKGLVKFSLGIAKHKQAHSKKQELREKDIKRSTEREIKGRLR